MKMEKMGTTNNYAIGIKNVTVNWSNFHKLYETFDRIKSEKCVEFELMVWNFVAIESVFSET